jgi:MoxR-like ATPase
MGQIKMEKHFSSYEKMEMAGRTILVPGPDRIEGFDLVGRGDEINKALAAWSTFDDIPALHFRFYGPPGVGKNAIVNELAKVLNKDLYIMNGNEDMRAEDIACTPVQASNGEIHYVASPLFAAMLRGSIFFFDEIGKAPKSALDPLASVLDERLTLTSVMAGIRLKAKPGFLFCAALNDIEEDGIGLPGFLDERTRPAIYVRYQSMQEIETILKSRKPMIPEVWAEGLVSEFHNIPLSAREAINMLQYAHNKFKREKEGQKPSKTQIKNYLNFVFPEVVSKEKLEKHRVQNKKTEKLPRNVEPRYYGQPFLNNKKTVH